MRPFSVCLVLTSLVSLALAQEELASEESRAKKPAKGACKRSGPKLTEKNTKAYTKPFPENKCPCWWDLSKNNCACCKVSC